MTGIVGRVSLIAAGLICGTLLIAPAVSAGETKARVDSAWNNAQPAYPDTAQAAGEQGFVDIKVYVNSRGNPTKIRVEQSSGFNDLDLAAAEAVMNWKFVPATNDGDNVSRWTTVRVVFKLPQAAQNQPASY